MNDNQTEPKVCAGSLAADGSGTARLHSSSCADCGKYVTVLTAFQFASGGQMIRPLCVVCYQMRESQTPDCAMEMNNYSEYTVKIDREPSYYGTSAL